MKKKYSLKNKQAFNNVLQTGKKIRSEDFLISIKKSNEFKIGISIPKKLGIAVERIKYKRQIKSIIAKLSIDNLKLNIVVIVKQPWINKDFSEKSKSFTKQINKLTKDEK